MLVSIILVLLLSFLFANVIYSHQVVDSKCQKRSHSSCLEDISMRHWNISMKQYKRHLMFGHQPARPETIEYQYFGTRWKSIQHQVKSKDWNWGTTCLSKVWNLMAVPCPSWVCPWQIGKLPPNHEVRIIPEVKYLDADWYGVWIFNFDLHFWTLKHPFQFCNPQAWRWGWLDKGKLTYLPIIVNFIKPPEKANILLEAYTQLWLGWVCSCKWSSWVRYWRIKGNF